MVLQISGLASPPTVSRFGTYTASFDLSREYENPYDPAVIDVVAEFLMPSGRRLTIPAFWFQDYSVAPGSEKYEQYVPAGTPHWRVRFLPVEEGSHQMRLRARDGNGNLEESGPVIFHVLPSRARGPVRIHSSNPLHMQHANGVTYFPRGHNLCFEDGNPDLNGTAYYSRLLSGFGASGENWTRLWMTDFARTTLEWGRNHFSGFYSGVGVYSQPAAWRVDEFMRIASENGIYVQLVLVDHGQFSNHVNARWDSGNPYGTAEGGPVPQVRPDLFFSDPLARALFQRRLRYTIARWSAFPNLLAWELWNEVQWAGTSSQNFISDSSTRALIVEWHREMSGFLKAQDPFSHLVTTSSDDPGYKGFEAIWSLGGIDLVQSHHYIQPPAVRDARIREFVTSAQQAYGKPVIVGEMGVKANAEPECDFDPATFLSNSAIPYSERTPANRDHMRSGTILRNAIWSASMSQSGAMNWWWGCYLSDDERKNRRSPDFPLNERLFPALVSFWGGEDPAIQPLQASPLETRGNVFAYGLQNSSRAFLWLRDSREAYGSGYGPAALENRNLEGAQVTLSGLDAGERIVSLFKTGGDGDTISEIRSLPINGRLSLSLPSFQGDLALKIGDGTDRAWGLVPGSARVWVSEAGGAAAEAGYALLRPAGGSGSQLAAAVLTLSAGDNAISDLTVPAVKPLKSLWTVAEIEAPSNVGLALANPGAAPANIQLEIFSGEGIPGSRSSLSLLPGEQIARFLVELFPDHTKPFRGVLKVTSDVPIGMLTLRGTKNRRDEFALTTLPAKPDSIADDGNSRILPQVADGGGYQTEWLLLNPSDKPSRGKLRFYRTDGNPWLLDIGGKMGSELEYSINPHGLVRWISSGSESETLAGYCILEPAGGDPSPAASAVIRYAQQGIQNETGVPFLPSSTKGGTYWEGGNGVYTGIAFANPSDKARRIRLELYSRSNGSKKLEAGLVVPAGQHAAKLLPQLFPGIPDVDRGFLRFSSDGDIAFLALRIRNTPRGDVLTSSLLLGEISDDDEWIFPQIVAGGGYRTQFVLLNPGRFAAEGRILFRDKAGNPKRLILRGP